jgi:CO dehydrogenase/acetyl-CoA synthase beta subunit
MGEEVPYHLPMHGYSEESHINSQLLGAIVPVTAGVMRNIWYPKKMAEYLTAVKLQELGVKKDLVLERDSSFRSNTERRLNKAYEKEVEKEQEQEQEQQQEKQLEKPEVVAEASPSTYERATPIELELPSVRSTRSLLNTIMKCLLILQ